MKPRYYIRNFASGYVSGPYDDLKITERNAELDAISSVGPFEVLLSISEYRKGHVVCDRVKFAQIQAANPETNTLPDYILF